MPRKKVVKLSTPTDVRWFIGRLINKAYRDELDTDKLRALTYACKTLLDAMDKAMLEERVKDLEKVVERITSGEYDTMGGVTNGQE